MVALGRDASLENSEPQRREDAKRPRHFGTLCVLRFAVTFLARDFPLDMWFIALLNSDTFFSVSLRLCGESSSFPAGHGVDRSESIRRGARPLQARNDYVRHRSPGGPGVWVAADFVLFCCP